MIQAILAQASESMIIGVDGPDGKPKIPWSLPPDLKRFKELTTGHAVIMGRRTYDSIGKPLPNRTNIVVTHHPGMLMPRVPPNTPTTTTLWAETPTQALGRALLVDPDPFVIGGAQVYQALWPYVARIHLTVVSWSFRVGLALEWDRNEWERVDESPVQFHEGIMFRYLTYERRDIIPTVRPR